MAKISGPITKCEKCGGAVWDNRANKKNPKGPDFKCKDTGCAEAYWLDTHKSSGGARLAAPGPKWTWAQLQETYRNSLRIAAPLVKTMVPNASGADVVSAAATIFIAASRDGVAPPPQPMNEKPAAIVAGEQDDTDVPW